MKAKHTDEFEAFDKVMNGLLSVPYSKLQRIFGRKKSKSRAKTISLLIC
jgi:hypothetical protein